MILMKTENALYVSDRRAWRKWLEKAFREEVVKRLGFKKGNISIAVEDAIKDWLNKKSGKKVIAAKKAWLTKREEFGQK